MLSTPSYLALAQIALLLLVDLTCPVPCPKNRHEKVVDYRQSDLLCPVPCPKNRHEKVKQVWNCQRLKYKVTCCELHNVIYTILPGLGPNCPPPPCGL